MKVDMVNVCCSKMEKIKSTLELKNFSLADNLAQDMIRVSDYVDFHEGVFIGEFFDGVFSNMSYITHNYKVEEELLDQLKSRMITMVDTLIKHFPFEGDKQKIEMFNLMKDIRAQTTKLQFECYRGEKPKKRRTKDPIMRIEEEVEE